jgi:hypothetical protein
MWTFGAVVAVAVAVVVIADYAVVALRLGDRVDHSHMSPVAKANEQNEVSHSEEED